MSREPCLGFPKRPRNLTSLMKLSSSFPFGHFMSTCATFSFTSGYLRLKWETRMETNSFSGSPICCPEELLLFGFENFRAKQKAPHKRNLGGPSQPFSQDAGAVLPWGGQHWFEIFRHKTVAREPRFELSCDWFLQSHWPCLACF